MTGGTGGFEEYVAERNVGAARLGSILVAAMMPAGIALDLITAPEAAADFLPWRIGSSLVALALALVTYLPGAARFSHLLGAAPALNASVALEVMISRLGHGSPYYAGLNLILLGTGLLFHWGARETALLCAVVIGLWLVPALADPGLSAGPLFNNLYFLVLTGVVAVFANDSRFRLARREWQARTELSRTSADLSSALARLERLDRLKSEFFANVSHELRTPLTLILTPLEELLGRPQPPQLREVLEVMRRNAGRLLRLIDDLLELARIDSGGLRLNLAPVDLRALVGSMAAAFRPTALAREVELVEDLPGHPRDLHGDPHRLEIVLTNLLGNAIKFTPAGGRIIVRLREEDGGAAIDVEDTGPGIPEADLPFVFDRFYQVEGSLKRRHGGAGIGLALARELTELHGGTLTVRSKVGEGTTFTLALRSGRDHFRPEVIERRRVARTVVDGRRASDPRPEPEEPGVGIPAPPPVEANAEPILLDGARRPRVLVAEDQDDLRAVIRHLLAPDFEVIEAADGEEALKRIREERPDLVLSDVMMPYRAGTDVCREVKADAELRATPVILLTARTGSDAVLEGYSHGADDFITKPFHPRILLARVRAQLRIRALGLQLASQSRLAAVGTLAAGVAHEVRNPINAVINAARILQGVHADADERTRKLLALIEDGGRRIEAVTAALCDHARPAEAGRRVACDLQQGLEATLRLLEHRLGAVDVHRDYRTGRRVLAPAGELNQVFLNIFDNSLRAGAKNLFVELCEEGNRVMVRLSDDGPGVPQDVASRIFDPFFTTRPPGEGTGLGLYLSREIVSRCGGELRLDQRPGSGARFTLALPPEERT
jgi:signal transduction histidine kinase